MTLHVRIAKLKAFLLNESQRFGLTGGRHQRVDGHDVGKRFVVPTDENLTAFVELEAVTREPEHFENSMIFVSSSFSASCLATNCKIPS